MILFISLVYLYHTPSPFFLEHGEYYFDIYMENGGNILTGVYVGFFDIVTLGGAYGGEGVVGEGEIVPLSYPSFYISFNLIPEGIYIPSLVVGYENRGFDYKDGIPDLKGHGFFLVAGKTLFFNLFETNLSFGLSVKTSPSIFGYLDIVYSDIAGPFLEFDTQNKFHVTPGIKVTSEEAFLYFAFEDVLYRMRRGLKIGITKFF